MEIYRTRCASETRFTWANDNAGWDYFTADQQHSQNVSLEANNYLQRSIVVGSGGNASSATPTNLNVLNQGNTTYRKSFETTYTANTRWLTDEEAAFVVGLFDSRSTYIEQDGVFLPIVVTSSSRATRIANRVNPLFQYEIQYTLSNEKRTI